ncbi:hypothetical protein SAY86_003633 [Trapa natans]|uniref:NAC domain-containing protein n=1 Tax=Trapa natans TaxID=22666 RepID=A0AAN7MHF0_TRANT|nr:hypothetical protein SAY86_003633 [Trapa natans]
MGGASLPPGFRFHPTDEELVGYYLKRKVEGLEFELEVIPVIDLYKFDPWELPEKSFLPERDMEWFFFCPRDRKYPNGSRTNRATKAGYWKATGKDRKVVCRSSVWGYRKTLVFYQGRAPLGDRTNWVMHEYRLCDADSSQGTSPNFLGAFALCRVIKKNGNAQKITGSSRESFKGKKISGNSGHPSLEILNDPPRVSFDISSQWSRRPSPAPSLNEISLAAEFGLIGPQETDSGSFWVSPDLILDSSKECPHVHQMAPELLTRSEMASPMSLWRPYEHQEISPCSSLSNFPCEVELSDDFFPFGYSNGTYMGLSGNEGTAYNSYDLLGSLRDSNIF